RERPDLLEVRMAGRRLSLRRGDREAPGARSREGRREAAGRERRLGKEGHGHRRPSEEHGVSRRAGEGTEEILRDGWQARRRIRGAPGGPARAPLRSPFPEGLDRERLEPVTTRIYLVRHGATVLTAEDRFAGETDVEL